MSLRGVHEFRLDPAPARRATGEPPVVAGALDLDEALLWVDRDVVESLFQRGRMALIGHGLAGLAVVAFYATKAPQLTLVLWLLAFAMGWAVRAAVLWRHRARQPIRSQLLTVSLRHWEVGTVVSGVVWGLAVAVLFPYGSDMHRFGLVLAVVSFCLASPATSYAVFLLYVAACFLPLLAHLAFRDEPHSAALAVGMALVFVVILLVARQDQRLFQRLQDLKRRDALLVRQLEAERNAAQTARAQAEAANLAKSRFFSAASHDLRQPLHAMALFTRSLLHHRLDTPAMRLVTSIDDALRAMERLFDQILDLDRLDTGGLLVRPQDVRLEAVFRSVRVHVEAVAFDKGLALTFRGGQHQVHADPLLLERVLRNLVANAIRYTEDGGVLVACRRRGTHLALQVWDTGIGIAPNALPRVFEPFYQFEAAQRPETGEYRGLGLGLAIVRRLLDLMQAPLEVRTRAGHGSVFTVLLPPACDAPMAADAVAPDAVPSAPGAWTGAPDAAWRDRLTLAGQRIVVVESDAEEAQRIAHWLSTWSARVWVHGDVDSFERAWPATAELPRRLAPDLLIVGERVVMDSHAASSPSVERAGERLVAWLRAATGVEVPAVLLVATGEGAMEGAGVPGTFALGGLHRLARPVQANRLRALVGFKLSAAAGGERPH